MSSPPPSGPAPSLTPSHDASDPAVAASLKRYWRTNVTIMSVLLTIWAIAGLGCGVLFADKLNAYNLPGTGYPLGFWFAQQGSIIVFVLIILAYCILLNRLDKKHHDELVLIRGKSNASSNNDGEVSA